MASYNEIGAATLMRLIGTPACPVLIDLRTDEDFDADPHLIPGARRYRFDRVSDLATELRGRSTVVYCQKGLKIGHGAAAILRAEGIPSEVLEGGHVAWRDAGFPVVKWHSLPKPDSDGRTVWVTRHRPKIDRIACPWLIRRFVDPRARFLFVAPSQVASVAERFGAAPFDVDAVFWSHRGAFCTFDTMVTEFGIGHDALDRLATIVRGADTDSHDLAPEAAGLLAVSLGLSRMFRDDLEQLDAGMLIYDALYRWARDATEEGHDWPAASVRV